MLILLSLLVSLGFAFYYYCTGDIMQAVWFMLLAIFVYQIFHHERKKK
jgi:hypothetical protein